MVCRDLDKTKSPYSAMTGKYAKLKKDWFLRGWTDVPMSIVNWVTGDFRQLNRKLSYVIESCNGLTNFDSLAFLPEHHGLLNELIKEEIVELCHEGNSIEHCQQYRKANNPRMTGIDWCVTGRCNLNCRHCYMESPSGRYGELPFKDMVRIITQFERANVLEVSLTGGEPFLRKDILDIISLLAERNIWLSLIYSNGLLITEEHLNSIKKNGFSPSFQISFDGIGTHDQMRGAKGIESGVIEGIRRVREAGFPVVVATSIDRVNVGRLGETYELMKNIGIQNWRIARPQHLGNWKGNTTELSMDEAAAACEPILYGWHKDSRPFPIQLAGFYTGGQLRHEEVMSGCDSLSVQPTIEIGAESKSSTKRPGALNDSYTPNTYDCVFCREHSNLLPDGTLVPCPGYVDSIFQERMPNLFHEDLDKIWTTSFLREIVDIRKEDLLAHNPECAECALFAKCGLGCRASALAETGDLMARDPIACDLWKGGYKERFQKLVPGELVQMKMGSDHLM
jgi:radical SAM protein with 4Fe4S-binding SPASM domain